MTQADATNKVPLEKPELEYLVKKKNKDVADLFKGLRSLIVVIIIISAAVGIGMFIMIRISPDTFINRNEPPPDILPTCLKLMLLLLCGVAIGACYSYFRTIRKIVKDIESGEKTIERCIVIRKLHAGENNTYHVYINSVIRLSVEVTKDEYAILSEGDKINIAYSSDSRIFFGYAIGKNKS